MLNEECCCAGFMVVLGGDGFVFIDDELVEGDWLAVVSMFVTGGARPARCFVPPPLFVLR
jgi:hypothetical protein